MEHRALDYMQPDLTGLQPLMHGIPSAEQAARMVETLPLFDRDYRLAYTEECPDCQDYQWAYPAVWPCSHSSPG